MCVSGPLNIALTLLYLTVKLDREEEQFASPGEEDGTSFSERESSAVRLRLSLCQYATRVVCRTFTEANCWLAASGPRRERIQTCVKSQVQCKRTEPTPRA